MSGRRFATLLVLLALPLAGCGGGDGEGGGGAAPPTAADDDPGSTATTPTATDDRPIEIDEAWRWSVEPPGSVGMPAADDDGVAFTYGHLRVVLLDLDGTFRWEVERRRLRDVAPALTPDLVVVATEGGALAVDRRTGQVRWDTEVGERANGPVIVGGRAVVSTWDGSLTAFDLADGRVVWRTALPGPAIGPATTDGDAVAVTWEAERGDGAGAVVVDGADGRQRWSVAAEPGGVSGPAIVALPDGSGSVVVFVAGDIAVHGLDLADGSQRWREETDGRGSPEVPPLPLGDGEVLVPHRLAGLHLMDAGDGSIRWEGYIDDAAAERGGPAGQGPDGPFGFPVVDGRLIVVGPGWEPEALDWPGRVSGVAVAPDGLLLVGTREAAANHLIALRVGTWGGAERGR